MAFARNCLALLDTFVSDDAKLFSIRARVSKSFECLQDAGAKLDFVTRTTNCGNLQLNSSSRSLGKRILLGQIHPRRKNVVDQNP